MVGRSGCREAALELSLPFTLREGVPVRCAGLETVAPWRIAGDCGLISLHSRKDSCGMLTAGLSGPLSDITTSLGMSAICAIELTVEIAVEDCWFIATWYAWAAAVIEGGCCSAAGATGIAASDMLCE